MASTIILKRRINSIKSTRQITKAMQLVSASKLRKAQLAAESSRAYRIMAEDMLDKLARVSEINKSHYFKLPAVKQKIYVIITSNSGLAGAYNSNVLKRLTSLIKQDHNDKIKVSVIVIGNKGAQFVRRLREVDLLAVYNNFSEELSPEEITPLLKLIKESFEASTDQEIYIIYNSFVSIVKQTVISSKLLPVSAKELTENNAPVQTAFSFEPDVEAVLNEVANRLVQAQIWQSLVDSKASEHAMRMIATKNATDNANDLINDYTLELNTARQAAITQELAEISGGAEALNN